MLALLALVVGYVILLAFPYPFFSYQARFENITVYSDQPIPPPASSVLSLRSMICPAVRATIGPAPTIALKESVCFWAEIYQVRPCEQGAAESTAQEQREEMA